jgi:hypothetical protein
MSNVTLQHQHWLISVVVVVDDVVAVDVGEADSEDKRKGVVD